MRAGINNVGILSQYRPARLIDHVGIGERWDFVGLDRGAKILPPFRGAEASDWYKGNADAVYQNLNYIRDHRAEVVLILSGDHIYRMDYRKLVRTHLEHGADMTIAVKRMGHDERFGYATMDATGRVLDYEEKPSRPALRPGQPHDLRDQHRAARAGAGGAGGLARWSSARTSSRGCWPPTGSSASSSTATGPTPGLSTPTTRRHQDLPRPPHRPGRVGRAHQPAGRRRGRTAPGPDPRGRGGAQFLSSAGCEIEGTVIGSVLSPGVRVEKGAGSSTSILFHRCTVSRAGGRTSQRSDLSTRNARVGRPRGHVGGPAMIWFRSAAGGVAERSRERPSWARARDRRRSDPYRSRGEDGSAGRDLRSAPR